MERREGFGDFNLTEQDAGSLSYSFYYGVSAFFMMDTFTMLIRNRKPRVVLGEAQWKILKEWLMDVKDSYLVKFIATSSTFLFEMFGDIANDRGSGYQKERDKLLFFFADNGIENVFFLAGDLHEAHAISTEIPCPYGKKFLFGNFAPPPSNRKSIGLPN